MKYANLIQKLTGKPVSILPESLKYILQTADSMVAGGMDLTELFDDVPPIYEENGNVGIINIQGVILPSANKFERLLGAVSLKDVRSAIKQAKASNVENVILNINSPGGVVQGVNETAKAINDLNQTKDTVAYIGELGASAGYWLAAQAKTVLASESAEVGSIGVYLTILTQEKALAAAGIEANVIQAGKHKTLGISFKDLTDEEKAYLQADVDKTYNAFKAAVSSRGIAEETMQGDVYDGLTAAELNLVDGVQNSLEELVAFLQ